MMSESKYAHRLSDEKELKLQTRLRELRESHTRITYRNLLDGICSQRQAWEWMKINGIIDEISNSRPRKANVKYK